MPDDVGAAQYDAETDDQLIIRFRDGDQVAFAQIYDRHHSIVFHLCRLLLGNAAAGEEAMQETFLRLARGIHDYRPQGQFRAYLLRICRNCCINRAEYLRPRRAEAIADVDEARLYAPLRLGPLASAENREQIALLERALTWLPPRQREAVLLYAVDDMDYRQIAQVMELPLNTVKTLIHRARATLTEYLDARNGSD